VLGGVAEQLVHALGDDVAGGLVAADEDQQRLRDDLVVGHAVAVDLGLHEHAHQVVRGLGAPGLDDGGGVGHVLAVGVGGVHDHVVGGAAALRLEHVVGPAEQVAAVLGGHAQHVADHHHRQQRGDVVDEVALAALDHRVDDLVAHLAHLVGLVAHPAGGEAAVDQLAPAPVLGVVHVDHHRQRPVVGPDAPGVRERGRVLGDGLDVGVAADAPHLAGLVPVDRRVGAQPGVERVDVAGVERAVADGDVRVGGVVGHGDLAGCVDGGAFAPRALRCF
jgi:hypothetical protein